MFQIPQLASLLQFRRPGSTYSAAHPPHAARFRET
jgi:hypothetical protein